MPGAGEGSHGGHPDFRVGGKVFASLWADGVHAMVRLPPDVQHRAIAEFPDVYSPAAGAWGRSGCTLVVLKKAKKRETRIAVIEAWRFRAPKSLIQWLDQRGTQQVRAPRRPRDR